MTKGRKKIPEEVKILQGTNQPCRTNSDAPKITSATKLPYAPKWLTEKGNRLYHSLGEELMQLGIITNLNIPGYAIMVDALAKYIKLADEIKANGMYQRSITEVKVTINPVVKGEMRDKILTVAEYIEQGIIEYMDITLGNESLHPRMRAQKDAEETFRKWATEFGMTPASQSKIIANIKPTEDPDDNDFD